MTSDELEKAVEISLYVKELQRGPARIALTALQADILANAVIWLHESNTQAEIAIKAIPGLPYDPNVKKCYEWYCNYGKKKGLSIWIDRDFVAEWDAIEGDQLKIFAWKKNNASDQIEFVMRKPK